MESKSHFKVVMINRYFIHLIFIYGSLVAIKSRIENNIHNKYKLDSNNLDI